MTIHKDTVAILYIAYKVLPESAIFSINVAILSLFSANLFRTQYCQQAAHCTTQSLLQRPKAVKMRPSPYYHFRVVSLHPLNRLL